MVANISDFLQKFPKDVARPCNFDVMIVNNPLSIITKEDVEPLTFKCEASELPSRTFSLVEQKTYGPIQYFPVQNFYDKINMTFICSDDMKEKILFENWMNMISDSTGDLTAVRFDFNYKSTYQSDIIITQYDLTGEPSFKVRLFEAFPVSVHPMNLDWGAGSAVHKLTVTFAYRYARK